jgi:sigma-B regulation protein RsbU (phosphoserine phosphatase)
MYDFIQFNGQSRVGIFISDVSGHGVPAALISAMVKTLVLNAGNEKSDCSGFLAYLNNSLIDLAYNNFVTALYGIYDPATRVLRFARAGHPYPCLIEAGGDVRELRSNGRFLGVMPENRCEESSITLHPGDKVLFFTDGLVEAENARGEIFETTLLVDILTRMQDVTAETMISTIIENLFQFCEGGRINDDICMVVMEVSR